METELELDQLRRRTRAAQHAISYPLLVIGVVFINYGVVGFAPQPVAWRYAGALAFVALWALGKANEYATGVGGGRSDYLAIACGVFVATQLTLSDVIVNALWISPSRIEGMWVGIIGLGLIASGFSIRAGLLVGAGVATCATGIALAIDKDPQWPFRVIAYPRIGEINPGTQGRFVMILGLVLTVIGFFVFVRERRLS